MFIIDKNCVDGSRQKKKKEKCQPTSPLRLSVMADCTTFIGPSGVFMNFSWGRSVKFPNPLTWWTLPPTYTLLYRYSIRNLKLYYFLEFWIQIVLPWLLILHSFYYYHDYRNKNV